MPLLLASPVFARRPTYNLQQAATAADVLRTAEPYAIQYAEPIGTCHH
jgi:hypothetical protein